jgi:citrate synthase
MNAPFKTLLPNVFLLSYCLLQLRDSKDLFTPTFAVSRTSRWTSLYLEQYGNNRLIRLRAESGICWT